MTTLGEAFIAVHADTAPFRRELKDSVQKDVDAVEAAYGKKLGKAVSDAISDGADEGGKKAGKKILDGIHKETGDKSSPAWVNLTGALASALDDGISALPAELKAGLIVGLLAATPVIAAGLAGAVGAGVAGGFIGLGVLLAAQFEDVQDRFQLFQSNVRTSLVSAAKPFQYVLLGVLDQAEQRFLDWEPMLERIFGSLAKGLGPIIDALLDSVEYILDAVDANLGNMDIFAQGLAEAIYILGDGLSEILEILLDLGDDGVTAFLDLTTILTSMIVFVVQLIALLTKAYNWVRDLVRELPDAALALLPILELFKGIANGVDEARQATKAYGYTNLQYVEGVGTVVSMTKDEEKALKDLKDAINDASDAAWNAIDSNIEFEESLDRIEESIKRNGKTLDVETEKGRNNLRSFNVAIKEAQERAQERADSGKYNADQLSAAYEAEIQKIYKAAEAQGLSRDRLREIYGALIDMSKAPAPNLAWLEKMATLAAASAFYLEKSNKAAWNLPNRIGGPQPMAEGGIVRGPTNALIGEAGTEVVIPMTRPARAAALMRQSGLDRMLGGSQDTHVSVFLGNEAFDQHVQKIVVQDSRAQARQLNFGVRG